MAVKSQPSTGFSAGEYLEVTILGASGNVYLLTHTPLLQQRVLYLRREDNSLKKVATGKYPTDLYPKAI